MTTRADLESLVDTYLEALSARDASRLPVTPNVRYTENCQQLRLGKGLWATCTGDVSYRLYMADPETEQVGFFGLLTENGSPAFLALRLKADGGRIAEAEALVARSGNPLWGPETIGTPRPEFLEAVPQGERVPRSSIISIADSYFTGIELDNGNIVPLHPDCIRLENGVQTTSNATRRGVGRLPVKEGLSSGFYSYIQEIRDRRYPVVDEERGIVLSVVVFEHPGTVKSVVVEGFGELELAPFTQKPSSAVIFEAFKVQGGQIRQIEAVLEFLPYGTKTGWE
ncbi:MAG TPA: hypothetical protein VIB47_05195 [Dehalococcoidia bacterium]